MPGLPTAVPPAHLRPLAELPALRVADGAGDVRGWEVRDTGGDVLGLVTDLLADPDRLVSEFLVVSTKASSGESIVPLDRMEIQRSHLVPGGGLAPIPLRYQSTTHLTLWAAAAAAVVILVWAIWSFQG
jgi:hypothetical protein